MLATLTSKGQITIPSLIRTSLGLEAGARLDFQLQDDGTILLVPVTRDPLAVAAVLPKPPRGPASEADIQTAIAARAARRFGRSRS